MKSKKFSAMVLAALVAGALIAPAGIAEAKKKKAPKGPVEVGTDVTGDWGANVDANLGPAGDALGMDLVAAEIGPGEKGIINFVIKVNSLPPSGGTPEVARYTWDFNIDGELVQLDGKWSNYSRGACDPTSGQCPPPRDPGQQPFLVRGNCAPAEGTNVTLCEELGIVQGIFDPATASITIPVPMELIHAKAGSKITGATGIFGGTIEASHAAFFTSGNGPADTLTVLVEYTVPKF